MFTIVHKQILGPDLKRMDVMAPNIAMKIRPGQFVSLCPEEGMERIPLSVVDHDAVKGTITLIFQEVGATTKRLGEMPINDSIFSILGPLGQPAKIEKKGVVVCVTTGVGTAQILPICRAFKKAGNKVIGIVGAKTKKSLMVESQMRIACDKLFIATNDGSYEKRGLATDILKKILNEQNVDLVYAIGSTDMMQTVCQLTQSKSIETRVYLNPIMVDCMGMCGSCRVKVDGEVVLACTKGPEFDGHKVDFNDFQIRRNAFKEIEWVNRSVVTNQKRSEPAILGKWLSGLLRK